LRLYDIPYETIDRLTHGLVLRYQADGSASLWGASKMVFALAGAMLGFTLKRPRLKGLVVLSFAVYGAWVVALLRTHLFNPYSEPPNEVLYDGQQFMSHQRPFLIPSFRSESVAMAATILATVLATFCALGSSGGYCDVPPKDLRRRAALYGCWSQRVSLGRRYSAVRCFGT
jgi:hypothetical protein